MEIVLNEQEAELLAKSFLNNKEFIDGIFTLIRRFSEDAGRADLRDLQISISEKFMYIVNTI
jgi:hypothetical protein